MARFLRQLEQAAFKRAFEQVTQPLLEEALRDNLDQNTAGRRILRSILAIPGFNLTSNVLFSAGGELLAEHADELWPGDTRPYTVAMREILKRIGPLIVGATDATTDALEIVGDKAVDQVTNPAAILPADRRGSMDGLFFFYHEGSWRLIMPLRKPDGSVLVDEWRNPVPTNPDVLADYNLDDYTKPTTRAEKSGKKGKSTGQVNGPPAKRRMVIGPLSPLEAAQNNLFDLRRFPMEEAEAIRKFLLPTPSWENRISPDVDKVLSWLIDVLSLVALNLTALERQEVEDLVQKMKQRRSDPEWVNRRLGRFAREVEGFPLTMSRTYNSAALKRIRTLFSRIRDEIDITLEGEQSAFTKARKILQAAPDILRQVRETLATSAPWVMRGFWVWMAVLITGLLFLILGIVLPPGWVTIILAVSGGILGFAFTWAFPPIQSLFFWLPEGMRQDKDWLKGLGRRIAGFSLSLGCGILPLLIWLEFPSMVRVLLVATGVLAPMGYLFAYTEADREDLAKKRVLQSVTVSTWVFTVPAVVAVALVGLRHAYSQGAVYMNGPQTVKWAVDGIGAKVSAAGSWFGGLHWWHWAGGGAIVVFALILGTILFGGSKDGKGSGGSGSGDRAMTLASILIGIGAFVATLLVLGWLAQSCLREIGSWF